MPHRLPAAADSMLCRPDDGRTDGGRTGHGSSGNGRTDRGRTGSGCGSAAPSTRSVRTLENHVARLEAENRMLRAEAEIAAEQNRFQLAEVEHRLLNTFSTLQALVHLTARPGDTGDAFRAAFDARLLALARSHEMFGRGRTENGAALDEVIGRCLHPYDDASGRIGIRGPEVHLPAREVPALGLALHELTTNAVKYGALSVPGGRIDVTWQRQHAEDGTCAVDITWREQGGPTVRTPERRGFGSRLLARGLPFASHGSVRIDFPACGVTCSIRLRLPPADGSN